VATDKQSSKVYFSLGSNIDPQKHIANAVNCFRQDFSDVQLSNLYRCPAVGFQGDAFLNLVLAFQTDKGVAELLSYANKLEQKAGRTRVARGRFDARTLDVDLLLYGDFVGEQAGYGWPSDDVDKVAHVLCPLAEIAGEDLHPVSKQSFSFLWQEFDKSSVELTRLPPVWD
jgi:2-amino-4-hydroxy-6-hydroxymethyldihydropteridine diphosphokinase